jgi:hypothetical protein
VHYPGSERGSLSNTGNNMSAIARVLAGADAETSIMGGFGASERSGCLVFVN